MASFYSYALRKSLNLGTENVTQKLQNLAQAISQEYELITLATSDMIA